MSSGEAVLLNKSGNFKWFFSLKNCYGMPACLCFVLDSFSNFSFCIPRKDGPLLLFNAHIFPHSSIMWHLLKFFSLQFKVDPRFACVATHPSSSVCSVRATPERHVTGDAGRRLLHTMATSANSSITYERNLG